MSSDSEDSAPAAAAAAPEVTDLSNPEVVTKYKLAAQIANQVNGGLEVEPLALFSPVFRPQFGTSPCIHSATTIAHTF